jgi:hypothetical protein
MYLLKLQLNNPQIILKMFTAVRVGVDEPEINIKPKTPGV